MFSICAVAGIAVNRGMALSLLCYGQEIIPRKLFVAAMSGAAQWRLEVLPDRDSSTLANFTTGLCHMIATLLLVLNCW